MQALRHIAYRFARDEGGATAIEYGLIATLVAVGALGAMLTLGGGVTGSWNNTATKLSEAMNGP
jgi:pilus assembly protein Flp/PilA